MGEQVVPEISATEAADRVRGGAFLLDVREPDEWSAGHVAEATHVSMGSIMAERSRMPADREIVVVCRSGTRSARVAAALLSWGHQTVNLAGGLQDWEAAGLPIVSDTGDPGHVV